MKCCATETNFVSKQVHAHPYGLTFEEGYNIIRTIEKLNIMYVFIINYIVNTYTVIPVEMLRLLG
jgi:hypothetical protein